MLIVKDTRACTRPCGTGQSGQTLEQSVIVDYDINYYRTKSDLMIFLHPKILRDAATEATVSSEKYNYMRTEQLQMREEDWPITPREQRPMLPAVHDFLASPTLDGQPDVVQPMPVQHPAPTAERRR